MWIRSGKCSCYFAGIFIIYGVGTLGHDVQFWLGACAHPGPPWSQHQQNTSNFELFHAQKNTRQPQFSGQSGENGSEIRPPVFSQQLGYVCRWAVAWIFPITWRLHMESNRVRVNCFVNFCTVLFLGVIFRNFWTRERVPNGYERCCCCCCCCCWDWPGFLLLSNFQIPKAQYTPPTRRNCRVSSRRRCEHNSQLADDDCRRIRTILKLTKQTP